MITTDRDKLAAFHTTETVKEALRTVARHDNVSMSFFVHTLVINELTRRGQLKKDEATKP